MGFQANVLNVMIASPGDVAAERMAVTDELYKWNSANNPLRRLMLQPVKWETHSRPEMGQSPQEIINRDLLDEADIVIGIFGTRIGTATKEFISGSVEEIKRQVAAGKLAMLYFSRVPVDPNSIDLNQLMALNAFKEECRTGGLYAEFDSVDNLRSLFGHHLTLELNKPKYVWLQKPAEGRSAPTNALSDKGRDLLIAAASDPNGQVLAVSTLSGFAVQANGISFVKDDSSRAVAAWKKVLRDLIESGYLEDHGGEVYSMTEDGYVRAEEEMAKLPLSLKLSIEGTPDKQYLHVEANKLIEPLSLDLLTSTEAKITSIDLNSTPQKALEIKLEPAKMGELFSSTRHDRDPSNASGPAMFRLSFKIASVVSDAVLPVVVDAMFQGNTQWIRARGSKTFTFA